RDRFTPFAITGLLILLAALLVQPYVDRYFIYGKPRIVETRGSLSDGERVATEIFKSTAPSVVLVFDRFTCASPVGGNEETQGGAESGTGFIWDAAGHVVTNRHVVAGARELRVRLSSGQVVRAEPVGTAESYDLAVLRLDGVRQLPPALNIGTSA